MGAVEDLIKQFTSGMGVSPKGVTAFSKVVPYENVVNPTAITQFAEEQVNPSAYKSAADTYDNFMSNLYNTGGQRFGRQGGQNVLNTQEQQRQNQLLTMQQAQMENLNNYYKDQMKQYYEDPNAFQINDFQTNAQQYTPQVSNSLMPGTYKPIFNYYQ